MYPPPSLNVGVVDSPRGLDRRQFAQSLSPFLACEEDLRLASGSSSQKASSEPSSRNGFFEASWLL